MWIIDGAGRVGGPILKDKLWFFGSGNFEHTRTGTAPSSSAPFLTPTPNGIQQLQQAFPNNPAVSALAAIGPASSKIGNLTFGTPTTVDVLGQPIEFATARRTIALHSMTTRERGASIISFGNMTVFLDGTFIRIRTATGPIIFRLMR